MFPSASMILALTIGLSQQLNSVSASAVLSSTNDQAVSTFSPEANRYRVISRFDFPASVTCTLVFNKNSKSRPFTPGYLRGLIQAPDDDTHNNACADDGPKTQSCQLAFVPKVEQGDGVPGWGPVTVQYQTTAGSRGTTAIQYKSARSNDVSLSRP